MRNTFVIAAVIALGLVTPVAFLAGQYVSQDNERFAGPLNQGGGDGLNGLLGEGGANGTSFSFGCSQPAGAYGGIRVEGDIGALSDPETTGKHFKEVQLAEYKQEIEVEAILVPPHWDGMVSGKRVHSPLIATEGSGVSSPKLFLAISRGQENESAGTRAMDMYLKLGTVLEPGAVNELSDLDDQDPSVGGEIWVNFSFSYAKIQMEEKKEEKFSAHIELPGTWMFTPSEMDKSSPMLYMAVRVHRDVAAAHGEAEFALDLSIVFDEDTAIDVGDFELVEEISFTFRNTGIVNWNLTKNKAQ